ncbi:MAG: LysM peptidoglycan-binding domain-containing protein [Nitrospirota bacterium]
MKKTAVFISVLIVLIVISLISINNTFSLQVPQKYQEPEEHIVIKFDTLWDISDSKLQDPFLWPKLWNYNPHIENPDLIYPGTKILIPSREELMSIPAKTVKKITKRKKRKKKKKESEAIFIFKEKEKQKHIVTKEAFISSGWIAADFTPVGEIAYAPMNRSIVGKGDTVYLNFSKKSDYIPVDPSGIPSLAVGSGMSKKYHNKFFTVRFIKTVKHPVSGNILGRQLRITGVIELVGSDNNMPKATIKQSFEHVEIGEKLLPFKEMEPPLIPDSVRNPRMIGYVVETYTNSSVSGKGDIIFLDKGQDDGLAIGDVFSALDDPPVERPIGKIQIVSLQPTTSAALILNSSQEVSIGSKWGNK